MRTVTAYLSKGRPLAVALTCLLLASLGFLAYYSLALPALEPICVIYADTNGILKGLDCADIVYEWQGPGGGSQRLAVFYGSDWEAGPLGTLSLGAAHIAAMYGHAVCSEVTPQAEAFLSEHEVSLPTIYRSSDTYINNGDARSWFVSKETSGCEQIDLFTQRGHLLGGSVCSDIAGVQSDGYEAFAWHWNGAQYERVIGATRIPASAVVVLFTGGGFLDSGSFPGGLLASDGDRAVACAEGRALEVQWWHRGVFEAPLVLEYPSTSGEGRLVHLPKGRIWFEILAENDACSVGE